MNGMRLPGVESPLIATLVDFRVSRDVPVGAPSELSAVTLRYDFEPVRYFVEAKEVTQGPWAPKLDFTEAIRLFIV
jgi:hypothetical protein